MPQKKKETLKTGKEPKQIKVKTAKPKTPSFYLAVGRRKTATARVKLQVGGTGRIIVNKKPIEEYFSGEIAKKSYLEPLVLTNSLGRFDIFIKVEGSGYAGQLGAVIHGLARALEKVDKETYRSLLKKQGLLTRDARAKERRKPGLAGKARKKKQSPKR